MRKPRKPDHYLNFYVADYYKDTTHLRTIEHGAYLLLIFHAWTNGGNLPMDSERLRSITRMNSKEWRASRTDILKFFYIKDGAYRHKRIDEEIAKAEANIAKKVAAGMASAEARWGQQNGNTCLTGVTTPVVAERQQNDNPSTLTIRSSDSIRKPISQKTPGTDHTVSAIDQDFQEFYDAYGRKRDPKSAREQFAKALKIVDFETLMAGVRRYVRVQPDPQFRKDPHRWLRDQRWRDEDGPAAPAARQVSAKERVLADLHALDVPQKTHEDAFQTTIDSFAEEIEPPCFE